MAVAPQITAALSAGAEDVLRPRAWLGGTMVSSLQLLDDLRRPAAASEVTITFRRPDGVEIAVIAQPSEPVPAPPRWLGACELTMAGTWAVRAVSLLPYRMVDWLPFDVIEEPQDVQAPYAALWLQQDGQVSSTSTGGLLSAARIDLLPLAAPEDGLKFAGVTGDGASVRIAYEGIKAGATAASIEAVRVDIQPLVDDAAQSEIVALGAADIAIENANLTRSAREAAATSASNSEASRNAADAAALAAAQRAADANASAATAATAVTAALIAASDPYLSIADGLANTPPGEHFVVLTPGDDYARSYQNNGGVAELINGYPSTARVVALDTKVTGVGARVAVQETMLRPGASAGQPVLRLRDKYGYVASLLYASGAALFRSLLVPPAGALSITTMEGAEVAAATAGGLHARKSIGLADVRVLKRKSGGLRGHFEQDRYGYISEMSLADGIKRIARLKVRAGGTEPDDVLPLAAMDARVGAMISAAIEGIGGGGGGSSPALLPKSNRHTWKQLPKLLQATPPAAGRTYHNNIVLEGVPTAVRVWYANDTATPWVVDAAGVQTSAYWPSGADPKTSTNSTVQPVAVTFNSNGVPVDGVQPSGSVTSVTVPAGTARRPGLACSDIIPVAWRPRLDGSGHGHDLPVLCVRTYSAAGARAQVIGTPASWATADAINRGRTMAGWSVSGNAVTTTMTSPTTSNYMLPHAIEYWTAAAGHAIITIGDSNTAGRNSDPDNQLGWAFLTQCALSTLNNPVSVCNLSYSGATTAEYEAFGYDGLNGFAGGANKIVTVPTWSSNNGSPVDPAFSAMLRLADCVRSAGGTPIMLTPFPNDTYFSLPAYIDVTARAKALASQGYRVLDINALISDPGIPGKFAAAYYSDGTHGNDVEQSAISAALVSLLTPLLIPA